MSTSNTDRYFTSNVSRIFAALSATGMSDRLPNNGNVHATPLCSRFKAFTVENEVAQEANQGAVSLPSTKLLEVR